MLSSISLGDTVLRMEAEFGRNRGSVVVAKPWPKPRLLSSVLMKTREDSMSVPVKEGDVVYIFNRTYSGRDVVIEGIATVRKLRQ